MSPQRFRDILARAIHMGGAAVVAGVLGSAALAIGPAQAQPLVSGESELVTVAYDGFAYPVGGLDGANGGFGWTNSWYRSYTPGGFAQVQATGLTYPGLDDTGGSVIWGTGGNQINGFSRSFDRQADGIVFVRVLTHFTSQTGFGTPNLRFYDDVGGNVLTTFLLGNNGQPNMAILDGSATILASSNASMNQLLLSIVRIDHAQQTTSLWVNPDLSTFDYAAPPQADAVANGFAPSFSRVDPLVRNGAVYDEISVLRLVPPPPPPVPPQPASAPRDLTAIAQSARVTLNWQAPETNGTFAVTHYQVSGRPSASCLVPANELSCEVRGLQQRTDYSFRVRALTGAGWSPWSEPTSVVPLPIEPTIMITGSRDGATVMIEGVTTSMAGERVTPWIRFRGPHVYGPQSPVRVRANGTFIWQSQTPKKMYVYFRAEGDVVSNRVIIPAR